jgi:DNA-binding transcriptional MerR regulator
LDLVRKTFTSNEVIALTGISARQLQWWDERGIVVPSREGHKRIYSRDDLAEVAILCDLRRRGFSLQKIRTVIRFLRREMGKRLVETVTASAEYHLLTDGRHIFLEDSARAVVDLLKNARQPMLSVCLSDTLQRALPRLDGMDLLRPGRQTGARVRGARRPMSAVGKKHISSVRNLSASRRTAS